MKSCALDRKYRRGEKSPDPFRSSYTHEGDGSWGGGMVRRRKEEKETGRESEACRV